VYVCLALVELDGDHELDAELRTNALVQRTTWLTSRIIAYVNDVFSYEKERRAGDPNNFVHTLRLHHGLDLSDAVARTIQAHDRELAQLLALERALHRTSPEIAERIEPLLAGCRAWMVGALQWQRIATRYATGRALLDPDMQCAATGCSPPPIYFVATADCAPRSKSRISASASTRPKCRYPSLLKCR
jgi:hypothetical protein